MLAVLPGPPRLHGVGQAVHEQLEIPRRRFETCLAFLMHDSPPLSGHRRADGAGENIGIGSPGEQVVFDDQLLKFRCGQAIVTSVLEDHKVEDLPFTVVQIDRSRLGIVRDRLQQQDAPWHLQPSRCDCLSDVQKYFDCVFDTGPLAQANVLGCKEWCKAYCSSAMRHDVLLLLLITFYLPNRFFWLGRSCRRFVLVYPCDASSRSNDVGTGNASARHAVRPSPRIGHANALAHEPPMTSSRPLRSKIKHSNDGNPSSESQRQRVHVSCTVPADS